MKKQLIIAIWFTLATTLIFGVIYPLAVTAIAQVVFPSQANGSLIVKTARSLARNSSDKRFQATSIFIRGRPQQEAVTTLRRPADRISAQPTRR
jgi:potassium-transporting ATPase KdpC subunit